ncbi:TlpA family protein disulfide reductase [Flavobacteriaceae bacterium XHP0103]|uniref:TlpA family protein disulfide reductase n=1 Tax=Marixanthotalea marina TaxID=2844359 RepID=UPI002989A60C|nr:TlpA disulfide reductase family protein [Marixanthotalea marina]MBU3822918.1 TlpA family protein disulfide reductase [Marixanthotalea marina]
MKKINYLFVLLLAVLSCETKEATQFSTEALNDTFTDLKGNEIALSDILEANKGKTIVLEVWASWCSDCIKGMPKLKALQNEYKDAAYVFLSLDRNHGAWKRGIEKYNVIGQHYFMESGREGAFGAFADLNWIPRYMVIGENGEIKLFEAIEADDNNIAKALK